MRNLLSFSLLSFLLLSLCVKINAQSTVIEARPDTLIAQSTPQVQPAVDQIITVSTHDPRKATLYATVLPGLGQIYNGKYWKLPIVYGGLFTLGYFINYNHNLYIDLRRELIRDIEGKPRTDPRFTRLTTESLRRNVDRLQRDRDYLIIVTGVAYALTIVDAHVDAHLKEFDVNEDLSFKIGPRFAPEAGAQWQAGLSLKLYFK